MPAPYWNPRARVWRTEPAPEVISFHRTMPGYRPTELIETPGLATDLGVGRVLVKQENARFGLPAFKILGAAYAITRALAARLGAGDRALPIGELRDALAGAPRICLVAATDGNHGRAVAHVARLLGLPARIHVPAGITAAAKQAIVGEGAELVERAAEYDAVVRAAAGDADRAGAQAQLIQDTSWPGYRQVPQWIVDGYGTLFAEADEQLAAAGAGPADLVAVPVGVGSLAEAAVAHYRSGQGAPVLLGVEPESAPAVLASLRAGRPVTVPTRSTVMTGLNCGSPSADAWPVLHAGMDAAVEVGDPETIRAVHDLAAAGVDAGPCGAAALAGVRALLADPRARRALGPDATVLLLSTEGRDANPLPEARS